MTAQPKTKPAAQPVNLNMESIKLAIAEGKAAIKEGKTKVEAATIMFKRIKDEPREAGVAALIQGASLTERGAMTYWYNCRRKLRTPKPEFGPGRESGWTDFDLSSAYPTAMSLIGKPRWREISLANQLDDFTPSTLGFAWVEFKFPPSVRFPTLPVRTANGLMFPSEGRSYCAAPEICLARSLGAQLTILQSVLVPTNPEVRVFGEFIKDCIAERQRHAKGSLEALLWKEIANSTYGKTAQGLQMKRVYDLRANATKLLPRSRITNPYCAAFMTSAVRATLGEIMNALPGETTVFSCTTDGFLTDASRADVANASRGPIAQLFSQARETLTGDGSLTEIKHAIRQPLGWRTRGQATLNPGQPGPGDKTPSNILARGGIYLRDLEDTEEQNKRIVEMFFNRTPQDKIETNFLTGIRDMVNFDADLVPKYGERRLNMEFDWKRRPSEVFTDVEYNHVAFDTAAWTHVEDFQRTRELFTDFQRRTPRCIKTVADYEALRSFADVKLSLPAEHTKYLRSKDGDLQRLRRSLCSAWRNSLAGLQWRGHPSAPSGVPSRRWLELRVA